MNQPTTQVPEISLAQKMALIDAVIEAFNAEISQSGDRFAGCHGTSLTLGKCIAIQVISDYQSQQTIEVAA